MFGRLLTRTRVAPRGAAETTAWLVITAAVVLAHVAEPDLLR